MNTSSILRQEVLDKGLPSGAIMWRLQAEVSTAEVATADPHCICRIVVLWCTCWVQMPGILGGQNAPTLWCTHKWRCSLHTSPLRITYHLSRVASMLYLRVQAARWHCHCQAALARHLNRRRIVQYRLSVCVVIFHQLLLCHLSHVVRQVLVPEPEATAALDCKRCEPHEAAAMVLYGPMPGI